MKSLVLVGVLLGACHAPQPSVTSLAGSHPTSIHRFLAGSTFEYIVDANVQACFIAYIAANGGAMAEISCADLKAAIPQAAQVITWESRSKRPQPETTNGARQTDAPLGS